MWVKESAGQGIYEKQTVGTVPFSRLQQGT